MSQCSAAMTALRGTLFNPSQLGTAVRCHAFPIAKGAKPRWGRVQNGTAYPYINLAVAQRTSARVLCPALLSGP